MAAAKKKMAPLPSALVGVAHRAIHVANVDEDNVQAVFEFIGRRCGGEEGVERWWREADVSEQSDGSRLVTLTIVFASQNSVSSALMCNHLPFMGRPLLVWLTNQSEKPKALLAIMGPGDAAAAAAAAEPEDPGVSQERIDRVKGLLAQLKAKAVQKESEKVDAMMPASEMTDADRRAFYASHAVRQARALTALTQHYLLLKQGELDGLKHEVAKLTGLPVAPDSEPDDAGDDADDAPAEASSAAAAAPPPSSVSAAAAAAPPAVAATALRRKDDAPRSRRRRSSSSSSTSSTSSSSSDDRRRRRKHQREKDKRRHRRE